MVKTNLSHLPTVNSSYHVLLLPKSDMILPNGAPSNCPLQIKSVGFLPKALQNSEHIFALTMPKDLLYRMPAMANNLSQNALPPCRSFSHV